MSGAITNMPVNNCSSFNFTDFVILHKVQLEDSAVPDKYWPALFEKLKDEVCLRISNVTHAYIIAQFGMVDLTDETQEACALRNSSSSSLNV